MNIWKIVFLALWIAGTRGVVYARCADQFPSLADIIFAIEDLKETAKKPDASFREAYLSADAVRRMAEERLGDIQNVGCADNPGLSECLDPIHWICEAVPPTLGIGLFKDTRMTREESLLFALQPPIYDQAPEEKTASFFFEPKNFFELCCGDFGCADGVGALWEFTHQRWVHDLVELASVPGEYGDLALHSLERSLRGVKNATCSCGWYGDKERKAVLKNLKTSHRRISGPPDRHRRVEEAVRSLEQAIRSGVPSDPCALPGY